MRALNKKAQSMGLDAFLGIVITVVIIGICVALLYLVIGQISPTFADGTGGNLSLGNVTSIMGTVLIYLGIAVTVVVLVIIINYVLMLRNR